MDPNSENNQENQNKRSEGLLSRGINTFNNIQNARAAARAGKAALKVGRVAAQAGSRLLVFLFATPEGWAVLGIIAVVIIVFVIVFALGNPSTATPTPGP